MAAIGAAEKNRQLVADEFAEVGENGGRFIKYTRYYYCEFCINNGNSPCPWEMGSIVTGPKELWGSPYPPHRVSEPSFKVGEVLRCTLGEGAVGQAAQEYDQRGKGAAEILQIYKYILSVLVQQKSKHKEENHEQQSRPGHIAG